MKPSQTYTALGMQKDYELEKVRDLICGLYGQDCKSIYDIPAEKRERFTKYLDRVLESFDEWRETYE